MRSRLAFSICLLILVASLLAWFVYRNRHASAAPAGAAEADSAADVPEKDASADHGPTGVYAHNLMLRKGPDFRVYVRWLRGQMVRTRRNEDPSFDDPDSFILVIKSGIIRANIGDIANYLNSGSVPNSPLKNVSLSGDGDQIRVHGTVHKIVPLPIELVGTLAVAPGNLIQIHVTKINVLKLPLKGLLGGFHVSLADLVHSGVPGVEVSGNDIVFDTVKLLPPPHIRGQLTSVRVANPDLEEVFGDAQDEQHVEQWRNFLRLSGGTLDFGKLTMHKVDLIMVDISNDAWFDLDLANYQAQLTNGVTRMTPQEGMQIFMPGSEAVKKGKSSKEMSIEWFKNRNLPPPADVISK